MYVHVMQPSSSYLSVHDFRISILISSKVIKGICNVKQGQTSRDILRLIVFPFYMLKTSYDDKIQKKPILHKYRERIHVFPNSFLTYYQGKET